MSHRHDPLEPPRKAKDFADAAGDPNATFARLDIDARLLRRLQLQQEVDQIERDFTESVADVCSGKDFADAAARGGGNDARPVEFDTRFLRKRQLEQQLDQLNSKNGNGGGEPPPVKPVIDPEKLRLARLGLLGRKTGDGGDADAQPSAPENSDEYLALIFSERHEADLRFVAKWGQWFRWDGSRWALEETLYAFDMARAICREAAKACEKHGIAKGLASAKTVAAVERLAKVDRKIAATHEQWDTDQDNLNTGEGD